MAQSDLGASVYYDGPDGHLRGTGFDGFDRLVRQHKQLRPYEYQMDNILGEITDLKKKYQKASRWRGGTSKHQELCDIVYGLSEEMFRHRRDTDSRDFAAVGIKLKEQYDLVFQQFKNYMLQQRRLLDKRFLAAVDLIQKEANKQKAQYEENSNMMYRVMCTQQKMIMQLAWNGNMQLMPEVRTYDGEDPVKGAVFLSELEFYINARSIPARPQLLLQVMGGFLTGDARMWYEEVVADPKYSSLWADFRLLVTAFRKQFCGSLMDITMFGNWEQDYRLDSNQFPGIQDVY